MVGEAAAPKEPVDPDSMLFETDSEEMKARNKKNNTKPPEMKRPASKSEMMKKPAAAPAAAAAAPGAESAVESETVPQAKSQASKSMKRPAAVSKTPLQSSKAPLSSSKAPLESPLQSDESAAVEGRPGAEIGSRPLSTSFFPNADSRYADEAGDWEAGLGNKSCSIHFQI